MKTFLCLIAVLISAQTFAKEVHIVAVGDVLIHNPLLRQGLKYKNDGGFRTLWSKVTPLIKKGDISYANVEGPMADGQRAQSEQMSFNFPSFLARDLKDSGFDIISTANNHSLDRGVDGLRETIDALDDERLDFMGTRKSLRSLEGFYKITKVRGVKILWIACTEVNNSGYSDYLADCSAHKSKLGDLVKNLKARGQVDLAILTPHWGNEKDSTANSNERNLARYYFNKGIDLILGAHPHVVQNAEFYSLTDELGQTKNRLVLYSLGNFVSNQLYWGYDQRTGALANVYIDKNKKKKYEVKSYNVVPVLMSRTPYFHLQPITSKSSAVSKLVKSRGLNLK